jgi:LysM repeat protein
MAYQVVRFLCIGLITVMTTACSGGASPSRPDGPGWSLNDKKPQGLGYASSQSTSVPSTHSTSPYEYRGGRDPVTGQARAAQTPATPSPPKSTASTVSGRTAALPNVEARPPTAAQQVEVRKGDTLHGLSLQHHVSVNALMAANNLTTAKIMPGQKLVIPPQL